MERNGHILFPTVEYGISIETDLKKQNGYHQNGEYKNGSAHESNGTHCECESANTNKKENYRTILRQCLFGHAPYVTQILNQNQSSLKWSPLVAGESILRSVSNVALVSNPLSGLLILIAMFIATPSTTCIASITLCSGLCTSLWLVRLPLSLIRSGGVTFNCFLLGIVIGGVSGKSVLIDRPEIIIVCILSGALTIIVWCGLNGILSLCNLPVLNAPVNVLGILYIGCGIVTHFQEGVKVQIANQEETSTFNDTISIGPLTNSSIPRFINPDDPNGQVEDSKELIWSKVIGGTFYAVKQIFGTNTPITAAMVYIAMLIYSPILFTQAIVGSALGSLMGVGLTDQAYTTVYSGGWAYNSFLTSASLGGLFLILNFHSWLIALCGSILTALLYAVLERSGKPILGLPFMVMTWLILPAVFHPSHQQTEEDAMESGEDYIPNSSFCQAVSRVPLAEITTPEIHLQTKAKYNRPWTNSVRPTTSSA